MVGAGTLTVLPPMAFTGSLVCLASGVQVVMVPQTATVTTVQTDVSV